MANVTTGNPWVLDTAGVITTNPLYVKRFLWTPTTDGDDILVHDNAGNVLWSLKAVAADTNEGIEYERIIEGSVNGLNLVTIDNGTLNVVQ